MKEKTKNNKKTRHPGEMRRLPDKKSIVIFALLFLLLCPLVAGEKITGDEQTLSLSYELNNPGVEEYCYKIYSLATEDKSEELFCDWTTLPAVDGRAILTIPGLEEGEKYVCYVKQRAVKEETEKVGEEEKTENWSLPTSFIFEAFSPTAESILTADDIWSGFSDFSDSSNFSDSSEPVSGSASDFSPELSPDSEEDSSTLPVETPSEIQEKESTESETISSDEEYNLLWTVNDREDSREVIGYRYKFYPTGSFSSDTLDWFYVEKGSEIKTTVYDTAEESYTFEVQSTFDNKVFSPSAYGVWLDRVERSRFSLGGYLSPSWNLKYFPNAKMKGVKLVTYSTLPFEAWTVGLDASYRVFDWFSIGADTSFSVYDYRKDLKDHFVQYSTEVLGELKFSLGTDITKSYRKNIYRYSLSLLGGGALYTNNSDRNLVPGGGVKLAVEVYTSSTWVTRMVLRTTAYYMQQVDSRYNSLDATVSCGLGVSWNSFSKK